MFNDLEEMNKFLVRCEKCPRLVEFRVRVAERKNRYFGENYWSKPVPGYGDHNGKFLILGLAPAATGGNRTGRIFTGDKSAEFLVSCLYEVGFTNKGSSISREDGLIYYDTYVTAVVKCVPPNDRPTPEEMKNCLPYLKFEIDTMRNLRAILVLGRVAFQSLKMYYREKGINIKDEFVNGSYININGVRVFMHYHPSPRNVNTGRVKREEFIDFLKEIKEYLMK
ncbi:MAG: uracil-DNA glycosylase [Thermoplasmata archaeon]